MFVESETDCFFTFFLQVDLCGNWQHRKKSVWFRPFYACTMVGTGTISIFRSLKHLLATWLTKSVMKA